MKKKIRRIKVDGIWWFDAGNEQKSAFSVSKYVLFVIWVGLIELNGTAGTWRRYTLYLLSV